VSQPFVFSYLAFSTLQQGEGRSSDRQLSVAETWAEKHGFRLAPERQYCDEGVSRYNGRARMKGALSRFLLLCGTPAVPPGSILIVEDFDRLSRENADDAWELFRCILLADVEIVVVSLDRWFKKESLQRFEDRLLVQACQHRAHQESKTKADRQRDIWADRRKRAARGEGIQTKLPSWIRRREDDSLEIIPERAETIHLMVRLALEENLGARRIAHRLTTGPDERPCWLDRGEWDSECVQQILRRPAVWGAYQPMKMNEQRKLVPHGELVRGHYPAVLTEEEAERVRRTMAGRKRDRGRSAKMDRNVLRSLVRDAESGQHLRLKRNAGRDYLDRRWQGRSQLIMPYHTLENLVLRAVHEWTPEVLVSADQGDRVDQRKALLAELKQIDADRSAIEDELSRPGRAASTAAIFARQLDTLEVRETEVKEELANVQGGKSVSPLALKECQSLALTLASLPEDEKPAYRRKLNGRLREVIEGVWVYRRRITARTGEIIVQIWPRVGAA
jgi:DNA invertase Pin-like site-specific DNA recombinase